jgi:hypothetical protein
LRFPTWRIRRILVACRIVGFFVRQIGGIGTASSRPSQGKQA